MNLKPLKLEIPPNPHDLVSHNDITVTGNELEVFLENCKIHVDRGDLCEYDFTKNDLITDANWHVLDLSGILPEGSQRVRFRVRACTSDDSAAIQFRRKGNINTINVEVVKTQYPNRYYYDRCFLPCGIERKIEYLANNANWTVLDIAVISYTLKDNG